jgi:hypothetical protein
MGFALWSKRARPQAAAPVHDRDDNLAECGVGRQRLSVTPTVHLTIQSSCGRIRVHKTAGVSFWGSDPTFLDVPSNSLGEPDW